MAARGVIIAVCPGIGIRDEGFRLRPPLNHNKSNNNKTTTTQEKAAHFSFLSLRVAASPPSASNSVQSRHEERRSDVSFTIDNTYENDKRAAQRRVDHFGSNSF